MAFLVPGWSLGAPSTIRASRGRPPFRVSKFSSRRAPRPTGTSSRQRIRSLSSPTNMTDCTVVDRVYEHWFGSLHVPRFDTLESQNGLWYSGTKEVDDDIRQRFGKDVEMALEGKLDYLIGNEEYPIKSDLALVILLDQYPRNIYRGTAKAFAGDAKSREIVMGIVTPDRWATAKKILPPMIQSSFLLPLMHQESVEDIDLCAEKLDDLIRDCRDAGEEAHTCAKVLEKSLGYAGRHKDILVRFGRYPYRNVVLGRESTEEELEFLKDGPRFGQ